MIILLDTSTPICQLVIVDSDSRVDHQWESGRSLAKGLLRFLDERLVEAGGSLKRLTGIGIMKGPGSFTGLRIGITVANTLADSLNIPIVGETGDDWQESALSRLRNGQSDEIVLPLYGGEAHITQPRK